MGATTPSRKVSCRAGCRCTIACLPHGPDASAFEQASNADLKARPSSTTHWPSCSRLAFRNIRPLRIDALERCRRTTPSAGRLCANASTASHEERTAMKLASLKNGRDGALVVVSRDLTRAAVAGLSRRRCRRRSTDWAAVSPRLAALAERLEAESIATFRFREQRLRLAACRAPINGPTARPMSTMSRSCARRAARRCRRRSGPIR